MAGPIPALPQKLYVVLHGLISLVQEDESGFQAFVLDMGAAHRYLVGNWLLENEIAKGASEQLVGVDTPAVGAKLDPQKNPIVKGATLPPLSHPSVRAVFKLPPPEAIFHLTVGNFQGAALQDTGNKLKEPPKSIAGVRVFRYGLQNPAAVKLGSLWSCPTPIKAKGQRVAVLHIYSQPGVELDPLHAIAHNKSEFETSANLLGAQLALTAPVTRALTDDSALVPLFKGETACLAQREKAVLELVGQARNGAFEGTSVGGCGSETCAACDGTKP
jgi:hypothetical protein